MRSTSSSRKSERRRRRWGRRALWSLAFLILVGASLYLTRERTVLPFLARLAKGYVQREYGAALAIGSLRGDLVSELELRDVTFAVPEDRSGPGGLRSLELEQLRCEYTLWDLVRGRLSGLRRLRGSGLDVHVRLEASVEPEPESDGTQELRWPEALPDVALERVDLLVERSTGPLLRAERASLQVGQEEGVPHVRLTVPRLALPTGSGERVDAVDVDLRRGSLASPEGAEPFELSIGGFGISVEGSGNLHADRADFSAEARLASLDELGELFESLRGKLSGNGSLRVNGSVPFADPRAFEGTANLRGETLAWGEHRLRDVEADLVVGPERTALQVAAHSVVVPGSPEPLDVQAALEHEPGALGLESLEILAGADRVTFTGRLPVDVFSDEPFVDGELQLSGRAEIANVTAWGAPIEGRASATLELSGSWSDLSGELRATGAELRSTHAMQDLPPGDLEVLAEIGEGIHVRTATLHIPEIVDVDAEGRVDLPTDPRTWFAGGVSPLDSRLEGKCRSSLERSRVPVALRGGPAAGRR